MGRFTGHGLQPEACFLSVLVFCDVGEVPAVGSPYELLYVQRARRNSKASWRTPGEQGHYCQFIVSVIGLKECSGRGVRRDGQCAKGPVQNYFFPVTVSGNPPECSPESRRI